jgi:uncharacterized protein YqeY
MEVSTMSIKDQIMDDFKEAMKDQDEERKNTLKRLKSAIRNEEIEQGDEELSDDEVRAILSKEAKNHKESIEQYEDGGRDDLVEKEKRELEIVQEYLPDQLSDEELEQMVDEVIEETGASDMSDMGDVMDAIMPKVRGRADGSVVNELVRERLS